MPEAMEREGCRVLQVLLPRDHRIRWMLARLLPDPALWVLDATQGMAEIRMRLEHCDAAMVSAKTPTVMAGPCPGHPRLCLAGMMDQATHSRPASSMTPTNVISRARGGMGRVADPRPRAHCEPAAISGNILANVGKFRP